MQFKKPFQLLHKTRQKFGARVPENAGHSYWLTTYDEIRTYFTKHSDGTE